MELLRAPGSDKDIKQQFIDNFGRPDERSVGMALEVMKRLNLVDLFRQFESRQTEEIEREVDNVPTVEIRPILHHLVQKMHGRRL